MNDFYRHINATHALQRAFAEQDETAIQEGIRHWPCTKLGSPLSAFPGNPLETKALLERGVAVSTADISLFFNWFDLSHKTNTLAGGIEVWGLWLPSVVESPILREHCLQRWARNTDTIQELWSALRLADVLVAHRATPVFEVKTETFSLLVDVDPLESPEVAVVSLNLLQLAWVHMNFEACQVLLSENADQAGLGLEDSSWPDWTLEKALAFRACWTEGLPEDHRDMAKRLLREMAEEDVLTMDSCQALKNWLRAQQLESQWEPAKAPRPSARL